LGLRFDKVLLDRLVLEDRQSNRTPLSKNYSMLSAQCPIIFLEVSRSIDPFWVYVFKIKEDKKNIVPIKDLLFRWQKATVIYLAHVISQ
jgi:hypothetical protein